MYFIAFKYKINKMRGIEMSATNRGAVRKPYDFYATPIDVVENLLDNIDTSNWGKYEILEPSAGNGNVVKAIRNKACGGYITSIEIREEEIDKLKMISDNVIIGDFFEL